MARKHVWFYVTAFLLLLGAVLWAVLVMVTVTPAQAAPGDLDPTFGTGGTVITAVVPGHDRINGVALQADGKVVVAGQAEKSPGQNAWRAVVARYNTDGTLDTSFDGDGMVITTFGPFDDAFQADVLIQPDGKIIVGGRAEVSGVGYDFGLMRFNTNGSLDTSFDGDGKATTNITGTRSSDIKALDLQSDGKIVAAGTANVAGQTDWAVARYNANGSLDTSFDGDGKLTIAIGAGNAYDEPRAVAVQPDGKIVVAGFTVTSGNDLAIALVRYNADGSLDGTFGTGGIVTTNLGSSSESASGLALQPDGKIVVAGSGGNGFLVARYNTGGSLDTTFGTGGIVTTPGGGATSLAIQADGKFLVAGSAGGNFALVRYNTGGSLDMTFGIAGISTADFGVSSLARGLAIQGDNKIVLAGYTTSAGSRDFALARYEGGAANTPPQAFDQTVTTTGDRPVTIVLTASDADTGDTLSFIITSLPSSGDLSEGGTPINPVPHVLTGDTVTYSARLGFAGTDRFAFKANDGTGDGNVATVTIVVNGPIVKGTVSLLGMPNPISGARITFSTGDLTIARVFSDPENGSFEIQLTSGIYDVKVEKDGFLPATKIGEVVNQDMTLPGVKLLWGDTGDGRIGIDDLVIPAKNLGKDKSPWP